MLALRAGTVERYAETLIAGCVENLQYDRQCEENRAAYFMRLLDEADLVERARDAILSALPSCEEGWDHDWMLDLLEEFAKRGDGASFNCLCEWAQRGDERAQDNLAQTGEEGLAWVAENVIPHLPLEGRWRVGMWLPDDESDDETPLQRRLRALDEGWDETRALDRNQAERVRPAAKAFFASLDDPRKPHVSPYDFRRVATRRDYRIAAERLLRAKDRRSAFRIARAFRGIDFPLPVHRLFRHATHETRGAAVCRILGKIDAPQVRHFARRLLQIRPLPWDAIRTLTASLRPGDEALVLKVLPDVEAYDRRHLHDFVMDVVGLFREKPQARWQPHAEWVYEHSPCSMCRASAVAWMAERGRVPPSIIDELPYDAETDIREVAYSQTGAEGLFIPIPFLSL